MCVVCFHRLQMEDELRQRERERGKEREREAEREKEREREREREKELEREREREREREKEREREREMERQKERAAREKAVESHYLAELHGLRGPPDDRAKPADRITTNRPGMNIYLHVLNHKMGMNAWVNA